MERVKWFKESATFAEEIRLWKWWFVIAILFIIVGVLLRAARLNAVS